MHPSFMGILCGKRDFFQQGVTWGIYGMGSDLGFVQNPTKGLFVKSPLESQKLKYQEKFYYRDFPSKEKLIFQVF